MIGWNFQKKKFTIFDWLSVVTLIVRSEIFRTKSTSIMIKLIIGFLFSDHALTINMNEKKTETSSPEPRGRLEVTEIAKNSIGY